LFANDAILPVDDDVGRLVISFDDDDDDDDDVGVGDGDGELLVGVLPLTILADIGVALTIMDDEILRRVANEPC